MEGWGPNDVRNYSKATTGRICGPAEVPPTGVGLIAACHPENGGNISVSGEGPLGGVTPEPLPQNEDVHFGPDNHGIDEQTHKYIDPRPNPYGTG